MPVIAVTVFVFDDFYIHMYLIKALGDFDLVGILTGDLDLDRIVLVEIDSHLHTSFVLEKLLLLFLQTLPALGRNK